MKNTAKIISIVLAVVMLACTFCAAPFTATAAEGDKPLTVKVTSNLFPEKKATYTEFETDGDGNEFVTVMFELCAPGMYVICCDIDEVVIDPSVLEMKAEYNTIMVGRQKVPYVFAGIADQQIGSMIHYTSPSRMVGSFTGVAPAALAYDAATGGAITFIKLRFKVLDKTAGETTVRCDIDTIAFCEDNIEEPYIKYEPVDSLVVDTTVMPGLQLDTKFDIPADPEVTVLYGDVDGNGSVNAKDRITLTRHLAKWADYPESVINKANSDVDDNGSVNAKDRITLTRHLAKWTDYKVLPKKS